jgi:hypothetical protein
MSMRPVAILVLLAAASSRAADLRSGAAAVDITPPKGAPMAGYYYNRASEGVHDRLFARALVFELGSRRVALVACDLIHLTRPVVEQARRLIERETGIGPAGVMISATHAHTGPVILDESERYNLEGEMRRIAEEYVRGLPELIASSVSQAAAAMGPAVVRQGAGCEPSLAFHRRYYMKDGTIGWNPGKNNPNIVRPAGPIDPEVAVVAVDGAGGKPIATYVNYATIFVELGLAIKRASPFPRTIVVELANGNLGYVPDRRAYAGGNYEVVSSRVAEGGGEKLAGTAARMLEEAYRWDPSK